MKFLQPGKDWRKFNTLTIVGMVIVLALAVYAFLIASERVIASNFVKGVLFVALAVLVNLIDLNMVRTILHIRKRNEAVKFLIFAAINVIIFQVIFEVLGGYTQFLWTTILCSAMYNISFCYLFIVWFKLFDFVHEGLHEGLEGEPSRNRYIEECKKLENR